jgi:hypothetical protein
MGGILMKNILRRGLESNSNIRQQNDTFTILSVRNPARLRFQMTTQGRSQRDFQSVVGRLNAIRKFLSQRIILQIVRHMSQVRLAWLELMNEPHGSIDMQMRRVRFLSQRVDDQSVQAVQEFF